MPNVKGSTFNATVTTLGKRETKLKNCVNSDLVDSEKNSLKCFTVPITFSLQLVVPFNYETAFLLLH